MMSDVENSYENVTFINDIWIVARPSTIVIKISIFLPIVVFGIFTNSLLLYILICNGHLRTPINLLFGNMALADLLSLLIYPWTMLVGYFFQAYQFGWFVCKAEGGVECALLIISVSSLCVINYDRLTAIALPQETRVNKRKVKFVVVFVWVLSFIFATPLFIYRTHRVRIWLNYVEKYCKEDRTVTNTYWNIIVTIIVWLPLSIMLICYTTILVKLMKYERNVVRKIRTYNVSYKKKVVKTMITVVAIFLLCRIPFTVLIYYRDYLYNERMLGNEIAIRITSNDFYTNLWFVSKYLIFFNASINPVIYGMANEKIRQTFKKMKLYHLLFSLNVNDGNVVMKEKSATRKYKRQTSTTRVNLKKSPTDPNRLQNNNNNNNNRQEIKINQINLHI